ncbi:unnamed protein product [Hymenolepis diminuta]|nr:unnamed protein product [Hymenolepis diminuta]
MIEVEIKGHYGQYIKGFLKRLVEDKGVIVYADDLSTEELIPLQELSYPPKHSESIEEELNAIERNPFPNGSLAPHLRVEALLPVSTQENCQDNSFTEALANLQISQPVQQSTTSSRLANPLACLNCPSWWPCIVSKVRDAHAVVQLRPVLPPTDESAPHPPKEFTDLAANLSAMTEICERKTLRPATAPDAPSLSPENIFTHSIAIPQDLLPYASDLSAHQSILRHCGEPASLYIEKNHLVVISPSREVIHVVELLEDMHIRMLRQKCNIIRYIAQTKKNQEASGSDKDGLNMGAASDASAWSLGQEDGHFVETFSVPSMLMGLAIGGQGSNIRNARLIDGVVRIDVFEDKRRNESGSTADANVDSKQGTPYYLSVFNCPQASFKVIAESAEAAKSARAMLEYCVLCLLIPKRLVGRIVGMKSSNVYFINEKAGLRHIHLETDLAEYGISVDSVSGPNYVKLEDAHPDLASAEDANRHSAFYLLGTREAVEKGRVIIGFQLENIYDLEKLENEKKELLKENSIGYRQDTAGPSRGPRGSAAGDERQRAGSQMNRGRRNTNRPPRSAGDATDNHQDGSANQQDGETEESKKQEEVPPHPGPSTAGPRRRGGPPAQQQGGNGTQRANGNRYRNRNGGMGGNRVGGVESNGTTEYNEVVNGGEVNGKTKHTENGPASRQNGKRQAQTTNSSAAATTEAAASS